MYVAPALTDLGSFQELTLGDGGAATGGVIIGSLAVTTPGVSYEGGPAGDVTVESQTIVKHGGTSVPGATVEFPGGTR